MVTFLYSLDRLCKKRFVTSLARSGKLCYTGGNHRFRTFLTGASALAGSPAGAVSEKVPGDLENRAVGRGDGFRSDGGGQVPKARKTARRTAQTTISEKRSSTRPLFAKRRTTRLSSHPDPEFTTGHVFFRYELHELSRT